MNDFTKEELKIIHSSIDDDMSTYRRLGENEFMKSLLRKIQSMIDNYIPEEKKPIK